MSLRRVFALIFSVAATVSFFLPAASTHFPEEYYDPNSALFTGVGKNIAYISFWADGTFIAIAFVMAVVSVLLALFGYTRLLLWTGLLLLLFNFTGIGWLANFADSMGFSGSDGPLVTIQFLPLLIIVFSSVGLIVVGLTTYRRAIGGFFARNKDEQMA